MRTLSLFQSTALLGFVLFLFSAGFPPFDDATEVDLTLHMVQHVLIVLSGVAIAYPLFGRAMVRSGKKSYLPWIALLASVILIVYWHLPGPWDEAVINPLVHVVEHLSFLAIGLLSGSWLLLLSDSGKIGALLAALFGHMGYAVALISPWNVQIYALYSLSDQVILGWALLLTGPVLVVGIAYVIARNPDWLGQASGSAGTRERRETFLNRARVPRWVAPGLTILIVMTSAGYFAFTAYALANEGSPPTGGAIVYIAETPVNWQYSPQNITVVLGQNSTVTWVSHSISYDTVTGKGLAGGQCGTGFSSCAIAPGQTFTYTFTKPGVYQYYCIYHPWMTGQVTVLPDGA
jgi:plastocyanin/cytochrome c oxidase assembly factor CtaG